MTGRSDNTTPSPAASLPPELLVRIFEAHIASCKAVWDTPAPYDLARPAASCDTSIGPYTWLRVTHVCGYWRAVALASPLLWSHIALVRSAPCTEAMLARSQSAPLSVQTYAPRCGAEGVTPLRSLRLVLQQMHRIRALELFIKWWVFDDVAAALAGPAPMLERILLSSPSGLYDLGPVLPFLALSRESPPPLKEVTLCTYGFPWANPAPFRTLKRLHVSKGPIPCYPSVEDVLHALSFMPALTSLHIEDIFAPSSSDRTALPLPPTVSLPRLTDLTLAGDCLASTALLSGLQLPAALTLTLDFTHRQSAAHLALALPAVYAQLTDGAHGTPAVLLTHDARAYTAHVRVPGGAALTLRTPLGPLHPLLRALCGEGSGANAGRLCVHGLGERVELRAGGAAQLCPRVEGAFEVGEHMRSLLAL